MKKLILYFAIILLFIHAGKVQAAFCSINHSYNPNDLAKVTGTVVSTGLNSIEIFDEEQKRNERFVYLQGESYQKGEYIRIYYHPRGAIVAMIKKMTVLEYKANGQNLGYISH